MSIPLYEEDGRTRRAVTFNGLTLNNPADSPVDTIEINTTAMVASYSTATEIHPSDDGSEANAMYRTKYVLRMDMVARSPSQAALYDRVNALAVAFDPALARLTSPSTDGILPLDFDVPTLDTTNYPSGVVPSRYYGRARTVPIPPSSAFTGLSAFVTVELEIFDPRRYYQVSTAATWLTTAITIDNSLATYQSWPTSFILFAAGAGDAAYTLTRSAVGNYAAPTPLVIDMSGAQFNDVYHIDMAAHTIDRVRSGVTTDAIGLKVSGDWFPIVPGSQTLTPTNTTNMHGTMLWYRAFVV